MRERERKREREGQRGERGSMSESVGAREPRIPFMLELLVTRGLPPRPARLFIRHLSGISTKQGEDRRRWGGVEEEKVGGAFCRKEGGEYKGRV